MTALCLLHLDKQTLIDGVPTRRRLASDPGKLTLNCFSLTGHNSYQ